MKLSKAQLQLCRKLGYNFERPEILLASLTHSSTNTSKKFDNQRLEFLGDRVLALIISDALFTEDKNAREGELAPRLNVLVRNDTCAEVASNIGIGSALIIGRSEMISGGRTKTAILGDAMEAVIAAVYLDGGLEEARKCVLRIWSDQLNKAPNNSFEAKSSLQEWAQGQGMVPPFYKELSRHGPDHAPSFCVEVTLENGNSAKGEGTTKRAAEQEAAKNLLSELKL